MKANFTRIAVVLDRSGSMEIIQAATVGGFNEFVAEQKKLPGECYLSLARFDSEYERLYSLPLAEVPLLKTLDTRDMTALYDAQGRTITELGQELHALREEDRPEKVIVVTMTDGMENASKEWTAAKVAALVKQQRECYGWEFIYLGANQDAIKVAADMNIPRSNSITYMAQSGNVSSVMASTSNFVRSVRAGGQGVGYSAEDRAMAVDSATSVVGASPAKP